MNAQPRPWHELQPGMEMPLVIVIIGPPEDSFQTDHELIVWTFRAGGWIRFNADRVMDWGKPVGQYS